MRKIFILTTVAMLAMNASAQDAVTFGCISDTGVRTKDPGFSAGNNTSVEFRKEDDTNSFYALMGFEYQLPAGKKVASAKLHFITERVKGGDASIYGYPNDFEESANWGTEQTYVEAALESDPLFKGGLAGQWGKAIFDELADDKQNVESWTNTVDVTSYVKKARTSRVNFLFANNESTGQDCIYTKEANTSMNRCPSFITDDETFKPSLEVVFVDDTETSVDRLLPVADLELRVGDDRNRGANDVFELKYFSTDDRSSRNFGILVYELPDEIFDKDNYEFTGATLRLFNKMIKGSNRVQVYAYGNKAKENATYVSEESFVNEALEAGPILEYEANGHPWKACFDKDLDPQYLNADGWTNILDLTDHVNSLIGNGTRAATSNTMALMLGKKELEGGDYAIRICTKEATDIKADPEQYPDLTFAKEDIMPYLTVSYSKKKNATIIPGINREDSDHPVEIFDMNGMKVRSHNLIPGIYVKKQGSAVTKFIVK